MNEGERAMKAEAVRNCLRHLEETIGDLHRLTLGKPWDACNKTGGNAVSLMGRAWPVLIKRKKSA